MLLAILFDVYSHRFTCCCLTRLRLDAGRGRLASGGGCFHGCVFDELQLDLEIALSGVSAKIRPLGLFSPTEDKLKLSDDVIKDDFTSTPDSRIWDLSPMRLGAAKAARESAKSPLPLCMTLNRVQKAASQFES